MTDEIKAARKRAQAARRADARKVWANKFAIEIGVSWPRGVLGWIWAAQILLIPVGLVLLAIRLATLFQRKRHFSDGDPGGAA